MSEVSEFATFVLRLAHDEAGRLTGVVERVATGEKARVRDVEGLTKVLGQWLGPEAGRPLPNPSEEAQPCADAP